MFACSSRKKKLLRSFGAFRLKRRKVILIGILSQAVWCPPQTKIPILVRRPLSRSRLLPSRITKTNLRGFRPTEKVDYQLPSSETDGKRMEPMER